MVCVTRRRGRSGECLLLGGTDLIVSLATAISTLCTGEIKCIYSEEFIGK